MTMSKSQLFMKGKWKKCIVKKNLFFIENCKIGKKKKMKTEKGSSLKSLALNIREITEFLITREREKKKEEMASLSLFSVGKSLLEKLGPLVQQEALLLWNLGAELEKLNGRVTSIQALLLDAEEQQEHSHQVKDWLEKLEVLLFDAEDLLDDVATEALRKEATSRDRDDDDGFNCRIRCWTAVCFLFISFPSQLIYGLKMAHRVKSLREKLDAIYDDNTKLQLNPRSEEKGKTRKHIHTMSSIPDIVIGREDDLNHIRELLLLASDSSSSHVSVVSIVGMGGMGKTTLAQLIYNDRVVKEYFKLRLWACVSESFEVKSIIQKILQSATNEKKQDLELEPLANLLKEHISEKKYFLVLDDVWNFDSEEWDKLRSVLKSGASGSKILVTMRSTDFARRMSRGSRNPPYALSGLSSPQSWSLFRQVVSSGDYDLDLEELQNIINLEELKTEIWNRSCGIPLAVKTIGNLLYFKDPQSEWLSFLRSNKLLGARNEYSIGQNLKLSYDYLPSHLKRCFALCSLFPKDNNISITRLILLWISLGIVKLSSECSEQSLFDLGCQYFMDLAWRSFFQEIKLDWSNNLKTCKMHDLIHDLAVLVAGSTCKHITSPMDEISEKNCHISLDHDLWSPLDLIERLDKAKRVQTFYVSYEEWYQSSESWNDSTFKTFVSKFQSLRVLYFNNSRMEMLPHHIQELKHLRYFNMSFNDKMTRLPPSITMLQNLQVLILFGCKSLQKLPEDIHKLVNLWSLDCRNCFSLTHMPVGLGELTRLELLPWFVVGKDSFASKDTGGLDELCRLDNLRRQLQITNLGHLRSTTTLSPPSLAFKICAAANLKGKFHLDCLSLIWGDGDIEINSPKYASMEEVEWDESLLESLQPHSNIKQVWVSGYEGERCPSWIPSLTHIVTLTLSQCCKVRHGLHHLQGLQVLQKLQLVNLFELDYIDEDEDGDCEVMTDEGTKTTKKASKPFYPALQSLKLVGCPKLKGWRRTSSQFPKLSKLVIAGCPLLTSMPLFPTLEKKLYLYDTSLQPLLCTISMSPEHNVPSSASSSSSLSYPCSSSEAAVLQQYPLSKLKKLFLDHVHDPSKEWLQGMQHLTSLQNIEIEDCSWLKETLDWQNVAHVPNITIDGHLITKDGEFAWDQYGWNNFHQILQDIYEEEEEDEEEEDDKEEEDKEEGKEENE